MRNEYLAAENRILRGQINGRLLLSEGEKSTLAEVAQRLGRMALEEVANVSRGLIRAQTIQIQCINILRKEGAGARVYWPSPEGQKGHPAKTPDQEGQL